ncbi:MAG TPA: NAD(P)H-dependent oxidoreductase [Steroidobacteraceae bacterium]|nr:NAD(P)H-dependent oxidoreductase [Steroidobacteraceae bacterium]
MNVLIIHAHPEPRSFTTALKDTAVDELSRRGHTVEISDLYAMNFDPVAKGGDFTSRHDPQYLVYALEQRKALASGGLAPDIAAEVEKLRGADLIILSFPMFWFSVPAIMKGWIDRVLLSGLCYGGRRFYDRGGLRGKRMLAAFTLGSRETMFGAQAVHGELEAMLRPLLRGTFYYVGCDVLQPFVAWHVPYISGADRDAFLARYRTRLSGIELEQPIAYPSLDDFDDDMMPLRSSS